MISMSLTFSCNDTATTEIYTLSLHDALPICRDTALRELQREESRRPSRLAARAVYEHNHGMAGEMGVSIPDRKSTRLNSSHSQISYAVFCLKKKKKKTSRQHAYSLMPRS